MEQHKSNIYKEFLFLIRAEFDNNASEALETMLLKLTYQLRYNRSLSSFHKQKLTTLAIEMISFKFPEIFS